jgi:glycosyltransferase involved in cell wall biosynthesis
MEATKLAGTWRRAAEAGRPWRFLVSTTRCAANLPGLLGAADYSYGFVFQALAPVLDQIGSWSLIDRPESRLVYQAAKAIEEGFRPVHLALAPVHAAYLTPGVPTILFPFWEFPRLPDRDFGLDTRQNWVRVANCADLIVTACRLTAESFREAGVQPPVSVVPVPIDPEDFDVADWRPERKLRIQCRHVVWADRGTAHDGAVASMPDMPVRGLARLERGLKTRYHRYVLPWLNDRAVERIRHYKNRAMRRMAGPPPRIPEGVLQLSGLVYTSVFNIGDLRKNPRDLLSAFLLAFRDRSDVTLVLKLATNPMMEWHELRLIQSIYEELGIAHKCRVVVILDYLSEDQMRTLIKGSTYYVNTSRAEGACLPLQRAMAAGRPGLAPAHTAMADYMNDDVGFVLGSHPEPTHWPHDPQRRCETTWERLVWTDLRNAYIQSAKLIESDPSGYARKATAARARMKRMASQDAATRAMKQALKHLDTVEHGRFAWGA